MKKINTLNNAGNKGTVALTARALSIGFALVLALAAINIATAQTAAEKEDALLAILKSDAGLKEKSDACRQLTIYGSKKSIPVLASLLTDEKLSHMARYALEPIKDPSVDDALRNALGKVKGRLLVGVISSIGVRRDATAVADLSKFLNDPDPDVAQAAARALGSIGTAQAAKALQSALPKVQPPDTLAFCEGLFRCAEQLNAQGQTRAALSIYDQLRAFQQAPHQVRAGALRGAILARPLKDGLNLLQQSLRSQDYILFAAAVRTALEINSPEAGQILASELPKLQPDNQIVVLQTIAHRRDINALKAVILAAESGQKPVRIAAIKALPSIGADPAVPVLVKLLDDQDSEIAKNAQDSLVGFEGKAADDAILAMLNNPDAGKRAKAVDMVGRRRIPGSMPALLKLASDPDSNVRQSAIRRAGELGSSADLDALLALLNKTSSNQEINAIEQAISSICSKDPDQDACASKIISALANAKPQQKGAMLHCLSAIGNQTALKAVRDSVKDQDPQIRSDAIRALGDWKTADAAPDLLDLAKAAQNKTERILCLRSFFRLIGQAEIPVEQRLDLCRKAAQITETAEEKKMLLGALGGISNLASLKLIEPMIDDPAIANESAVAALNIIEKMLQQRRNTKPQPELFNILEKVTKAKVNEDISKRASTLLDQAKAKAAGK